jgi:hypothetical protein
MATGNFARGVDNGQRTLPLLAPSLGLFIPPLPPPQHLRSLFPYLSLFRIVEHLASVANGNLV